MLNFLIFSANNRISAFRINTLNDEIPNKNDVFVSNSNAIKESEYLIIKGKLKTNNALAGVGSPIKVSVWRISILKFAKR